MSTRMLSAPDAELAVSVSDRIRPTDNLFQAVMATVRAAPRAPGQSRAASTRRPGRRRVHRERDGIDDDPVLAARELERDLLVADVLRHALGVAREGIAVAAAARLLVQDDVAAPEGDGELGGHLARRAVRV